MQVRDQGPTAVGSKHNESQQSGLLTCRIVGKHTESITNVLCREASEAEISPAVLARSTEVGLSGGATHHVKLLKSMSSSGSMICKCCGS